MNPIEQAFTKLKAPLRTAAVRVEVLWHTIGRLLAALAAECANYLAYAG